MSAFDKLFGRFRARREMKSYFKMLDGYTPSFSTFDGGVYEMELTRSCIHAFASHASKLQPNVSGADLLGIQRILSHRPNPFMTGSQFLYKTATIYEAQNTVFILPVLNKLDEIVGFYPANPLMTEIVNVEGSSEPYLRFTFKNGEKAAIELSRVGVISKFLYNSDLVGEDNRAFNPTLELLSMQNQGITEGIKNSASFRFMANINNWAKPEDIKKERERFVASNFGPDSGGLALFPNTYTNVKQIVSTARVVDSEQMKLIQERTFMYFGTSSEVLQNKAYGDAWSAYYEGKIEPFALQLSQAITWMTYTELQLARGDEIVFSANRLQYMSNNEKLQVSSQLFDRGVFSMNDVRDVWNLPHVEDGDKHYIRKEYAEISKLDEAVEETPAPEPTPAPAPKEEQEEKDDTSK